MDKKVTKKMLQDLISEEIENLSEEETDGVDEGIMDRVGAWRAGRKRKKDVKQWEAFKGNLGHKLNQLAKSHQAGFKSITDDITSGGKEFERFAARFGPWTKAVEGIGLQIQGLENAAKAVERTPVEVSADETPEEAGERLGGGDEDRPEPSVRNTNTPDDDVSDAPVIPNVNPNNPRPVGESRKRLIKKAQKLLKENKKIKVVKSNGRKK
tara:strand:+ start:312 stop:944 length:633 start_codon:yes stop_codon:yes gene_type:complete